MRILPILAATIAVALAGPAGAAEKPSKRAETLVPKPGAKPQNCVSLSQIRESRVLSDTVIDFHLSGGRVLRNTLPNSCAQLGFEERFTYTTSLTQLCSSDIITVLTSPGLSRGASCGLGQFVEMVPAK